MAILKIEDSGNLKKYMTVTVLNSTTALDLKCKTALALKKQDFISLKKSKTALVLKKQDFTSLKKSKTALVFTKARMH